VSERAALFRAVLDNPDEDTPRLTFADWLATNGEPHRAAFIRTQVALAQIPSVTRAGDPWRLGFSLGSSCWTEPPAEPFVFAWDKHSPERNRLREEIRALEEAHAARWKHELPDDWPEEKPGYDRGFVEDLAISAGQLIRDPARYLDAAPVRSLTLKWEPRYGYARPEQAPVLAALPQLARLRRLAFSSAGREFVSAFVRAFVVMPEAAGLRSLDVSRTDIEEDSLVAVLYSDHPRELCALNLTGNKLTPHFLEELGAVEKLPGLRSLALRSCNLTPEGVERFFRGPLAGRLTSLSLGWNAEFGEGGVAALASCPHLARFRFVALDHNGIGTGGCRKLADSPHAGNLETFRGTKSDITGQGVAALLSSGSLRALNTLMLDRNPIDAAGVEAFANITPTIPLRRLDLSHCPLSDDGIRQLAESPLMRMLTHLKLSECGITDAGAIALASCLHLTNLRELTLSNNALTDVAAEALASNASLTNLERLDVWGNEITDRGGLRLTDLPGLRPYTLSIGGDNISKRGEEKIKKRLEGRQKPKA
jgi:uncharacterized protein (TIGR02996 family)